MNKKKTHLLISVLQLSLDSFRLIVAIGNNTRGPLGLVVKSINFERN